ncbi:hypothetical protein FHS89_003251 [Rubricella aquisinus]|uniref:Uncharacterized protein n=1 Tax=Rubricella aquisinus TaxID=2028108 RepID=A0A840X2X6_9RHOB|nr:hypothetical protein [Rubricella aquisinus]MBB5517204.1 hypothetical protein [Rubricella aquisinus]
MGWIIFMAALGALALFLRYGGAPARRGFWIAMQTMCRVAAMCIIMLAVTAFTTLLAGAEFGLISLLLSGLLVTRLGLQEPPRAHIDTRRDR